MSYKFGVRSLQKLSGVNPDLVSVMKKAISISTQDFTIIEGIRSVERQRELVKAGKSQTMNSRHITGDAIDLVAWPVSWEHDLFMPIADAVIKAAKDCDVAVRWGGNWKIRDIREWDGTAEELVQDYADKGGNFFDLPHFEIPR